MQDGRVSLEEFVEWWSSDTATKAEGTVAALLSAARDAGMKPSELRKMEVRFDPRFAHFGLRFLESVLTFGSILLTFGSYISGTFCSPFLALWEQARAKAAANAPSAAAATILTSDPPT